MIKIVGAWELGWNTPIMEYDLWAFPLRDFGIDEWIMTPVSGINKPRVIEVHQLSDAIKNNPKLTPVYIDEKGEIPLTEFEHPKDALYILGKANYSPWVSQGKQGISVRIETPASKGLLWPHQAVSIVLYDRMKKESGSNNNR